MRWLLVFLGVVLGIGLSFSAPKDRDSGPPGLRIASEKALENGKKQLRKGHCKQAIHEFTKAVQKDPRNFQAQYWLSVAEGMCGYHSQAWERLKVCRELSPSEKWTARVLVTIGVILYATGKDEEARRHFEMARRIDPTNELVRDFRGSTDYAYDIILRWLDY